MNLTIVESIILYKSKFEGNHIRRIGSTICCLKQIFSQGTFRTGIKLEIMTDFSENRKEYLDHGIHVTLIFWVGNSEWVDVFIIKGGINWQDVRKSLDTYVSFKFSPPRIQKGVYFHKVL